MQTKCHNIVICFQAKKSKSSNHLLGQHRPSPKSINLYKCKQCDFGCKKESDLKAHMLVSHGVQEGSSREAEKGVSTESLIAYDEKLEHGYYCTVCKYSPSSMRYLRDHIRKVLQSFNIIINMKRCQVVKKVLQIFFLELRYRVTIQVDSNLWLTSIRKFRFCSWPMY